MIIMNFSKKSFLNPTSIPISPAVAYNPYSVSPHYILSNHFLYLSFSLDFKLLDKRHDCCCSIAKLSPTLYKPAACQASLTFTVSQIWLRFMSIQSVMLSNDVNLHHPFSFCLQSFPTVGSFPVSQFFTSGDQSIGASASGPVLPVNIQACFPLGLIGLNSLLANGLLRVFFSRTIRKHQFFRTQPSLWSNFHICT